MKIKKTYIIFAVIAASAATYGLTMLPNSATGQSNSPPAVNATKPIDKANEKTTTPIAPMSPVSSGVLSLQEDKPISADSPNQISLNTQAREDIEQDTLAITMRLTLTNNDPGALQASMNQQMNDATDKLKNLKEGTQVSIKTGQMSISPKFDKQHIQNWIGVADIVIEGEDFAQISKIANSLNNFVITNVAMSVSQHKIDSMKEVIDRQAIDNFKQEAQRMTDMFGFKTYTLKNATVNYQQPGVFFKGMAAPAMATVAGAPALNVEPGKVTLQADVSGTIVLFK